MDQAIAFLAVKGCAQFIEWDPLKATPTRLPPNSYFVIANSLTKANKAATSDFNQRVIECRLACRILAKSAKLPWQEFERFATLQKRLQCTLPEFEAFADGVLTKELYSRDDIITLLDVDPDEFENKLLTTNTKHLSKFKLRQRAMHVIQGAAFNRISVFWAANIHKAVNDFYFFGPFSFRGNSCGSIPWSGHPQREHWRIGPTYARVPSKLKWIVWMFTRESQSIGRYFRSIWC